MGGKAEECGRKDNLLVGQNLLCSIDLWQN